LVFEQGKVTMGKHKPTFDDDELHWYALDVVRQKEYVAGHLLQRMGCVTFIPTETRWRKQNRFSKSKKEIAFAALPGVVFVGFDGAPKWFDVMNLSLVTGVLSINDAPYRIATATKEWLEYRSTQLDGHLVVERVRVPYRGTEIDRSQSSIYVQGRGILRAPKEQKHMRTKREFHVGQDAFVADGPFRFSIVTVKKITGARARVLLPLFGGTEATIPLQDLEAA
jgi:transcription antitermination factor NusG